jgi:sulfatase modifying factor 1
MKTIAALTLLTIALLYVPTAQAAIIDTFGTGTNTFMMTFEPIGNPGNAADTTGNPNPAGSVGYHYRMGKYEVSRDMINKANAEGNLGITLNSMSFVTGGPRPNMPATEVTWNEAARYVNWLNTSKGYSPAYKFFFQPGEGGYNSNANILLWLPGEAGYNAANVFRNSQAKYFLPSMDEWYKAAYYDPNANGGTGGYWNFPNGSDSPPTGVSGGTAAGTAVFNQPSAQGPADIDNAGDLSPYMVMGMAGNVWEWQENPVNLLSIDPPGFPRRARGGAWTSDSDTSFASSGVNVNPWETFNSFGFRVASIPEPSSAALLMLASVGLWQRRKRLS